MRLYLSFYILPSNINFLIFLGKTSKCDQIDLAGSNLMKSFMVNPTLLIYVQPHDVCPNDQKILI